MTSRKVAVVTGSSSGIGRATARTLAAEGYDLVLHGLLDSEQLAEAQAECEQRQARVVAVAGDMRDERIVEWLIETAETTFGRIDAVVSNAGAGLTKNFLDIGPDDWRDVIALHLGAATALCRGAFKFLQAHGGSVVLMSSVAAGVSLPGRAAYGTAKAAIEGLARNLGCEWARDGVRVNAVAPGTILTPLVEANFSTGLLDPNGVLDRTPMHRFGTPEEVASVVHFLLSDASSYMTGQTLHVDGGWSSWGGWS